MSEGQDIVNKDNIMRLSNALKDFRSRDDALKNEIEVLRQQIAMQNTEIQRMQQLIAVALNAKGHGPTQ